jgi:hypothetical protein
VVFVDSGVTTRLTSGSVHLVRVAVHDEEHDGNFAEPRAQLIGGAQQLDYGAEPRPAVVDCARR